MKTIIQSIIDRDSLNSSSRKQHLVHKRAHLYVQLRKAGLTLKEIGHLFNRDHSAVHYWINKYEYLVSVNDQLLLNDIKEYDNIL